MASERKNNLKREKEILLLFDGQVKDIRQQLNEQLKCLDARMETQVYLVTEVQDYFRRRAEVEMEYSRSLEKLSKSLLLKHKAEKQKREQWHLFSSYSCWQQLVASTRRQSRDHAVLSEIFANQIINRFTQIMEDVQRIYKRCREIGIESHEELLKVLHELHTSMKTYHTYHGEERQAESKLHYVESQRAKLEQSIPREKLERSKKFRLIEKEIQKRQSKYNDAKLKALKARNDYLLCMDAANSAIHKYFVDDLSDLIDCMDFGFHTCLTRTLMMQVSSEECLKRSRQSGIDGMNKCISSLDSRVDKQRFLEYNNSAFMVPKKFEFQPHKKDEVAAVSVDKAIMDELEQRLKQLCNRLTTLRTESEEIWKTLETAERSLLDMISAKDYDCSALFDEENSGRNGMRQPEALALKLRADRQETEDFYLNKFREYTMENNLITRLQAKADILRKALGNGVDKAETPGSSPQVVSRPHSLPHKVRKKRIGRTPLVGQPKLFGGSLEEYVEVTNQEIPLIIRSCVRIINLFGLHHQGIFRVSGSQVEINNFKETFERGEDPLADVSDASDINSVGGVLKLYLRELREPLFPIYYFEQLVEISQLDSKHEFICKVREVVTSLSRPVIVVLRYLFAFLNHLSEFSDENMMDPYNLAICFGPTLLPIPEDKDQVQYQNLVNELIKNIIIYQEEIFPDDGGIAYEKYISTNVPDENDVGDSPPDQASDQIEDSEADILPSEDDAVFQERELSLNLFGKAEVLEAVAQFDFGARSERELSFKRGDTLLLYSQVSNDWWKGTFGGKEGLIPDKYILLKIRDEDKDKISTDSGEKRRTSSSSDSLTGISPSPKSSLSAKIPEELGNESDRLGTLQFKPVSSPSSPHSLDSCVRRRRSLSPSSLNSLQPSSLSLVVDPDPSSKAASVVGLADVLEDAEGLGTLHVKDVSSYDIADDNSTSEFAKDLDSALAKVFSSISTLEREKEKLKTEEMAVDIPEKKVRPACKDTPDLVLDLPVNPSSPTNSTNDSKESLDKSGNIIVVPQPLSPARRSDSPELTAAERFAVSNQCTMKKGTMSRSTSHVSTVPTSTDAQTQTFTTLKRSASTSVDLALDSSDKGAQQEGKKLVDSKKDSAVAALRCIPPLQTNPPSDESRKTPGTRTEKWLLAPPRLGHDKRSTKVETVEIASREDSISARSAPQGRGDAHAGGNLSTFKPLVKAKPPVMKKPTTHSPSPEPMRRGVTKEPELKHTEYKQTSF